MSSTSPSGHAVAHSHSSFIPSRSKPLTLWQEPKQRRAVRHGIKPNSALVRGLDNISPHRQRNVSNLLRPAAFSQPSLGGLTGSPPAKGDEPSQSQWSRMQKETEAALQQKEKERNTNDCAQSEGGTLSNRATLQALEAQLAGMSKDQRTIVQYVTLSRRLYGQLQHTQQMLVAEQAKNAALEEQLRTSQLALAESHPRPEMLRQAVADLEAKLKQRLEGGVNVNSNIPASLTAGETTTREESDSSSVSEDKSPNSTDSDTVDDNSDNVN
jgi:hypothetical protein